MNLTLSLKFFSFLGYLNFSPVFPGHVVKNDLIRKRKLISIFLTSKTVKQVITIHILPNISRSKCNKTMKFRQLIEYNVRIGFLQNSC